MRLLRLAIAIVILIQAVYQKDLALGFLALLLMITAIANVGCCGTSGCKVERRNIKNESEIIYEELGEKK